MFWTQGSGLPRILAIDFSGLLQTLLLSIRKTVRHQGVIPHLELLLLSLSSAFPRNTMQRPVRYSISPCTGYRYRGTQIMRMGRQVWQGERKVILSWAAFAYNKQKMAEPTQSQPWTVPAIFKATLSIAARLWLEIKTHGAEQGTTASLAQLVYSPWSMYVEMCISCGLNQMILQWIDIQKFEAQLKDPCLHLWYCKEWLFSKEQWPCLQLQWLLIFQLEDSSSQGAHHVDVKGGEHRRAIQEVGGV